MTVADGNKSADRRRRESAPGDPAMEGPDRELRETLEAHETWLSSDASAGKRADFRSAKLRGVRFGSFDVKGISFRDADLEDADLSEVRNLLPSQLGGANLRRATLPDNFRFEGTSQATEISRLARVIFLTLVGTCVFSWLVIATTQDLELLTNRAEAELPIIGTRVPILGYYLATPLILLVIYVYLHLYLQSLWQELSQLPAVFPDGRGLDEHVQPWLVASLVHAHMPYLKHDRPPLSRFREIGSLAAAWWLAPVTLGFFWLRFLPRHELLGTAFQVFLIVVAVGVGVATYRISKAALCGQRWPGALGSLRRYWPDRWSLLALACLAPLSYWAIEGDPLGGRSLQALAIPLPPPSAEGEGSIVDPIRDRLLDFRVWLEDWEDWVDDQRFLDLPEAAVSEIPANWHETGLAVPPEAVLDLAIIEAVNEANLDKRDLRYAAAPGAFLVNAKLNGANLTMADLSNADLRGAKLANARLELANLGGSNLDHAILADACLRKAKLSKATLRSANLVDSDLRGAQLVESDFTDAMLTKADLRGALLHGVDLSAAENADLIRLEYACGDGETLMPESLKPLPHCGTAEVWKDTLAFLEKLSDDCEQRPEE